MRSFGERLKEERDRLDLNQDDFGALGGVKKGAQINYEKGERDPDAAYFIGLADAGVDVLYVLTGVRSKSKEMTPEEQTLLDNYRNADDEGRRAARRILDALAQQKTAGKKRA